MQMGNVWKDEDLYRNACASQESREVIGEVVTVVVEQ